MRSLLRLIAIWAWFWVGWPLQWDPGINSVYRPSKNAYLLIANKNIDLLL